MSFHTTQKNIEIIIKSIDKNKLNFLHEYVKIDDYINFDYNYMKQKYLKRVGYIHEYKKKLSAVHLKIYDLRINYPYCIYIDKNNNGYCVNREYKNLGNTCDKFEDYPFKSTRYIYLYKDGSTPWSNKANYTVYLSKLENAKKEVNIMEWGNKYSYLIKDPIEEHLKKTFKIGEIKKLNDIYFRLDGCHEKNEFDSRAKKVKNFERIKEQSRICYKRLY